MYLKSLQLIGFKSFVDKTTLEFSPGIGGIVGPNGCGKSNVSDAIRWVLGEQSAKALRGGEMVDVIFNGTDGRKPLGMAEVSLTIGDCEKELGLTYNEVTITRRVFRDGTGEYLLNKVPCRLKDIQQTFMDTGIGRASYWLMEQGKMDRILSARPEDRRVIFEEAAGITKYKAQKHEALNKLELTQRNLDQLDPLLKEIKRQIISLQRQAGKARRYKELTAELKALETKLARHKYDEMHMEIASVQSQVDALLGQLQEARRAIETEEAAVVECRIAEQAIERQIAELERRQLELRGEIRRNEDLIRFNQNRIEEIGADRKPREEGLAGADEKIRAQQQFVAEADDQVARQEGARALTATAYEARLAAAGQADTAVQSSNAVVQQANAALHEADRKISEIKNLAVGTEQKIAQLRNQRAQLEQQRMADARRAERLAAEEATLRDRMEKIIARAQSFQNVLGPFQTAATQARTDFENAEREVLTAIEAARAPEADRNVALDGIVAALQKLKTAIQAMFSTEIGWAQKRGEDESLAREQKETLTRIEAVQWELKQLTASADDVQRVAGIEKLQTALAQSEEQLREQLRAAQGERDQRATERDQRAAERDQRIAERTELNEKVSEAKLALQSGENACAASRDRREAATARVRELQEQVTRWQAEIVRDQERVTKLDQEIATARTNIEQVQTRSGGLEQELTAKCREREAATRITSEREATLRQKRNALSDSQQQRNGLEVKLAEKNKDVETLTREIMQRYNIELATVTSDGAAEDWVTFQDKVDELRIRVDEMGPVNTEAIQEYDELEKRHTEISQQQNDLIAARDNLKEAIAKINATAKQLFQETFDKIATNFQEMFTELFGGGRASLTLLELPEGGEDVLDRGVEIMARPPGKHLQTIGLLSGGEKAMTAIALIFAIYMVKPAPFCVFDELDAPLDESNVGRFAKVVQRFNTQSQFIMITHNKRTMSIADVLYGVTMQESGVSRIVSVNFSKEETAGGKKLIGDNPDAKAEAKTEKQAETPAAPKPVATEPTAVAISDTLTAPETSAS